MPCPVLLGLLACHIRIDAISDLLLTERRCTDARYGLGSDGGRLTAVHAVRASRLGEARRRAMAEVGVALARRGPARAEARAAAGLAVAPGVPVLAGRPARAMWLACRKQGSHERFQPAEGPSACREARSMSGEEGRS